MVKQREGYKIVILEPAKSRIAQDKCPGCGKSRSEWKRRKDWTCCSKECTNVYMEKYREIFDWSVLRDKALSRDKYKCVKCGYPFMRKATPGESINFIVDHIIPIALGGLEWDMNNIQTLCIPCNKIKTAQDAKKIAELRYAEKQQAVNKTLEVR